MAKKPKKNSLMTSVQLFKGMRKKMPPPSKVLGENKRKNAYTRKEKHKGNPQDFS